MLNMSPVVFEAPPPSPACIVMPGNVAQRVGQRRRALLLDQRARNDLNRLRRLGERRRVLRRRHAVRRSPVTSTASASMRMSTATVAGSLKCATGWCPRAGDRAPGLAVNAAADAGGREAAHEGLVDHDRHGAGERSNSRSAAASGPAAMSKRKTGGGSAGVCGTHRGGAAPAGSRGRRLARRPDSDVREGGLEALCGSSVSMRRSTAA